jgi:Flp pilus assembly secretin CpaC
MVMFRRVIGFVVFLLVLNAAVRWGTVYFHDQQFKDATRELALFAGQTRKTDEVLKIEIMKLAQEHDIPLDPDFVEIRRNSTQGIGEKVTIKFAYAVMISLIPGQPRRFEFDYTTP